MTGIPAPPRWAVWCAWAVPVLILPSAVWRASLVLTDPSGPVAAVRHGDWYLLLLSVLSLVLGLLTVGLVRPWGVVYPRWVPGLGGRAVSPRWPTRAALGGGAALVLLSVWFFVYTATRPFELTPVVATGVVHERPGWDVLRWYLPLVAWGPAVIAVALDHRRRRRTPERAGGA